MGGRITDELRRVTREQGGARPRPEEPVSASTPAATPTMRHGRLLVALVVALVAGGGWWLLRTMQEDGKLQDCVMSGRKNCVPGVDTTP